MTPESFGKLSINYKDKATNDNGNDVIDGKVIHNYFFGIFQAKGVNKILV